MTVLIKLCDRVSASLRQNHALAGVVQVHIRDTKLNITEHQRKLDEPIRLTELLFRTGLELIDEIWNREAPLRSIGIRAAQLIPQDESFQLSLGCDYERLERLEKLECVIGNTRERYGKDAIVRCRQLSGEALGIYSSFGKLVL